MGLGSGVPIPSLNRSGRVTSSANNRNGRNAVVAFAGNPDHLWLQVCQVVCGKSAHCLCNRPDDSTLYAHARLTQQSDDRPPSSGAVAVRGVLRSKPDLPRCGHGRVSEPVVALGEALLVPDVLKFASRWCLSRRNNQDITLIIARRSMCAMLRCQEVTT